MDRLPRSPRRSVPWPTNFLGRGAAPALREAPLGSADVHPGDGTRDDEALDLRGPLEDRVVIGVPQKYPDHSLFLRRLDPGIGDKRPFRPIVNSFRTLFVGLPSALLRLCPVGHLTFVPVTIVRTTSVRPQRYRRPQRRRWREHRYQGPDASSPSLLRRPRFPARPHRRSSPTVPR